MSYIEPICPESFEIFVVEGKISGKWMKLGASFFSEEAESLADYWETGNTKVRVRRYFPAGKAKA